MSVMAGGPGPASGFGASPPGGMGVTSQGFGQEGYVLDTSDLGPPPKPPEELQNFATGVPYFLPFATPYRDSWEVFRDDPVTVKQLIAMRRQDGQARALYRLLTRPILAALKNCDFVPADGQVGGQAEADFAKNLLTLPPSAGGMQHSLATFVKQMLLALFNGFTAWELIYWTPTTGPNKGKITLREIDWRPSETLTFLLDGQGKFNGFRQRTFFQGRTIDVKIEKDVAVYYAHEEAERPFYGVSMFESAFYHYDKKVKLYYIVHLAAQRAAVGLRIGTMPPNPVKSDKDNFVAALSDLGLAQWMTVPSADWTVTSLKEEGNFDFLGIINHHNSQMSKSVLAQWFDDAQGAGSGDSSLVDFGQQSTVTFMMMLNAILEEMADVINNQIIPRFIDWNFGSGLYPTFKWGELTEEQQAAIQSTFEQLAAAGQQANVTPEFMLALEQRMATDLGFDIDYDKIQKEREQQQKLQQQQQQQMFQQQMMAGQQQQQPGQEDDQDQQGQGQGQGSSFDQYLGQGQQSQSSAMPGAGGPGSPYQGFTNALEELGLEVGQLALTAIPEGDELDSWLLQETLRQRRGGTLRSRQLELTGA